MMEQEKKNTQNPIIEIMDCLKEEIGNKDIPDLATRILMEFSNDKEAKKFIDFLFNLLHDCVATRPQPEGVLWMSTPPVYSFLITHKSSMSLEELESFKKFIRKAIRSSDYKQALDYIGYADIPCEIVLKVSKETTAGGIYIEVQDLLPAKQKLH